MRCFIRTKSVKFSVCLKHDVSVGSGDGDFHLSTQRHYRRLIYYYIILLHISVVRPSSARKYINSYGYSTTTPNIMFQWVPIIERQRGQRLELSSLAQTLGSWVRFPLKAWMSVCVYCLCCPVCRKRPSEGLILHAMSTTDSPLDLQTERTDKAELRATQP
jgi:hypothetical protein